MAEDHYVSQTYLKHFAGASGMLRAYRKSDGHSFPCWPRDICREPNGDVIPDFLSDPLYLGAYRRAFEPVWNEAVAAFEARSPDHQSKMHIAGYWAQLMVCTPAWKRVAIEISNHQTVSTIRAHHALSEQMGKRDDKMAEAIAAFDRGEIEVATDPNFVRARSAAHVLKFAWGLYNANWKVFESDTDLNYVTSDNPAAFKDQGPTVGGRMPFLRFLPLTPKLCLMCDLVDGAELWKDSEIDFTKEPIGRVKGGVAEPATVEKINIDIAKCAEDLVLSGGENANARDLAATYSRFRIENQSFMVPSARGYLIGNRTRVIERLS